MRQPEVFSETRVDVMHAMMTEHAFAAVVSHATGSLSADHVPLVVHSSVDPLGALHGYVAVSNPLFRETSGPIEVLCLFQGPTNLCDACVVCLKKGARQSSAHVELRGRTRPRDLDVQARSRMVNAPSA